MASAFTANKNIEQPANNSYVDTWDVPVNADWAIIDKCFGGANSFNVVAVSGTVVLTATQYQPPIWAFSGALTADINYQLPTGVGGFWWAYNSATGAHTITISSAGGGTSVVLPQGARTGILCDGTNVFTQLTTPLAVPQGGTGAATLTGIIKGNGVAAFSSATPGTDYVAPGSPTTFTATQTFAGSNTALAEVLSNAAETCTLTASGATGTINFYTAAQSVLYYTVNASGNWIINISHASTPTTLNSVLTTGQSITIAFLATQGSTAFYNTAVRVDGTTSGVTTIWQGGAPASGFPSGIDVYTYTVIKTGSATFTVLATRTSFF